MKKDDKNVSDIFADQVADKELKEVFAVGFAAAVIFYELVGNGLLNPVGIDDSVFESVPSSIGPREYKKMRDLFPFLKGYFFGFPEELLTDDDLLGGFLEPPSIQIYHKQLYAFGLCVLKGNGYGKAGKVQ